MSAPLRLHPSRRSTDRTSRPNTVWAGALLLLGPLAMLIATIGISNAGASTSSSARTASSIAATTTAIAGLATPKSSQFCTYAENASKSSTTSAFSEKPSSLLASFQKLKSEEPAILAESPSQIRGDFQTLFNYFNGFYGELAKVGYNFLKLPHSYLATLESSASRVEVASKAITSYLTKTCGIKSKV